jgi:threonine/homoserine/homoserine lactone efflux protein
LRAAPPLTATAKPGGEPKWCEGTLLSLVNPKAYAAMAALFSSFRLVPADRFTDNVTKAAVLIPLIIAINIGWLMAGASLTRFFQNERTARIINVTFAVLLLASIVITALL